MSDNYQRHARLVDQMAQAQGLDLELAQMRGDLQGEDLEDAILRCTGCAQAGRCETWLATVADPSPRRPEYCRNAGLFDAMLSNETAQ